MKKLTSKQWRKKLLDATAELPGARTNKIVAASLFFHIAASLAKAGNVADAITVLGVGSDLLDHEWVE